MTPPVLPSPRRLRFAAGAVVLGAALVAPFVPLPAGSARSSPHRPAALLHDFRAPLPQASDTSTRASTLGAAVPEHRRIPRAASRSREPVVVRPTSGPVSSPFGWRRHPVSGRIRHHDGVDFAVPLGSVVRAAAPGAVHVVGRRSGYGLVVEVEHRSASGTPPVRTLYAHLSSSDRRVRPGSRVRAGQPIGASGGVPGRDGVSTGPHLHFEVRDARGRPLDPAPFLAPRSVRRTTDERRWQVMFSSGRKLPVARRVHRQGPRSRAAFALPHAAGSRTVRRAAR